MPNEKKKFCGHFSKTIKYKTLPDSKELHKNALAELDLQLDALTSPFLQMIYDYLIELNRKISDEQERVLKDFEFKLAQAHSQHQKNHDKTLGLWEPLNSESKELKNFLDSFVACGKSV
jgi:hypothetical protein